MTESLSSGPPVEKSNYLAKAEQDGRPCTYRGRGTFEDPFVVEWLPNDPQNPM